MKTSLVCFFALTALVSLAAANPLAGLVGTTSNLAYTGVNNAAGLSHNLINGLQAMGNTGVGWAQNAGAMASGSMG